MEKCHKIDFLSLSLFSISYSINLNGFLPLITSNDISTSNQPLDLFSFFNQSFDLFCFFFLFSLVDNIHIHNPFKHVPIGLGQSKCNALGHWKLSVNGLACILVDRLCAAWKCDEKKIWRRETEMITVKSGLTIDRTIRWQQDTERERKCMYVSS